MKQIVKLLEEYGEEICLRYGKELPRGIDHYALALGFFLGKGASLEKAMYLADETIVIPKNIGMMC